MIIIVISENMFSKYIEFDNSKIELKLKRLYLIYAKYIKKTKLKYFYKYKNNIILFNHFNKTENLNKREIPTNNAKVYDRLFNYSIMKENMLYNLSNKFLIDEEDKYPFIPKVNSIDSNFYIKNQNIYTIPQHNMEYYTERNDCKANYLNKIKNLKNNTDNYVNNYIKKKYIPINKQKIKIKNKKNYSNSFSQNNMINPYLEERIYNKNISSKKINNSKKDDIFPLTIKYKYNDFNNHFRNFIGEEKENGEKNVFNNKNNSNLNKIVNKSYSCKIYSSTKIIKRKKNNEDYINKIPIETNNCNFSRNNDLNIYLKNKLKTKK